MRKIKIIKNILMKLRTWIKIAILFIFATLIKITVLSLTYRPTYQVILNNEVIGYTENKSELQKKINEYIESKDDEQVEFIQLDSMPSYKMCLLKKDIESNDDEIYAKVTSDGVKYYKYYAITLNGEEKKYVEEFTQAESVVNQLKEKNSTNVNELGIVEKYDVELKELSNIETCVNELYVKPVEKKVVEKTTTVAKTKNKKYTSEVNISGGANSTGNKIELGIAFINPTSGTISSRFGNRSRDNHKGIDIAGPQGTPIKAAAAGKVIYSGYSTNGFGNHVIISHGNGVQTLYAHCSSLSVQEGQSVSAGTLIGKMGSTGRSTGSHLHFEIRVNGVAQDPQNYVY